MASSPGAEGANPPRGATLRQKDRGAEDSAVARAPSARNQRHSVTLASRRPGVPRMSAPLKRTPLAEEHIAAGARMVDFGGWDMPLAYGSQLEEHHAVRQDA